MIRLDDSIGGKAQKTSSGAVEYAALSYCWGGDQAAKTLKSHLRSRMDEFSLLDQPQSIRDAVHVARELGIKFLWVDSLCIIQDDEKDKMREIAQMHEIYQRAVITISAAISESSRDGFLTVRKLLPSSVRLKYRGPDGTLGSVVMASQVRTSEPIHSRGWTFQEHLLSRRTLVFGTFGIRWICRNVRHVDGFQGNSAWIEMLENRFSKLGSSDFPTGTDNSDHQPAEWRGVVRDFSQRHLTDPKDRLPAISAVATVHSATRRRGRYVAGLWTTDLPGTLLWEIFPESPSVRCQGPTFPTWSWALFEGSVDFPFIGHRPTTAQLLSAHVTLAHPEAPFGQVLSGNLLLRGRLAPVRCESVGMVNAGRPGHLEALAYERSDRSAAFAPVDCDLPKVPPTKHAFIKALLDTDLSIEDLGTTYCLEVFGEHSKPTGPTPGDFSIGLILRNIDSERRVFSRLGVYRVLREMYMYEYDWSEFREHFTDWIHSFESVTINLV